MKRKETGGSGFARACSFIGLGTALVWGGSVRTNAAQRGPDAGEATPLKLKVTRQMKVADVRGGELRAEVQAVKNGYGKLGGMKRDHAATNGASHSGRGGGGGVSFYPGDLINQGGVVLPSVQSHDIYVNCDASCFGYPGTFLTNLGNSNFMHVTDQYVGTDASHRYTVGQGGEIQYPVSGPLGPDDLVTLIYVAGQALGTGYGDIYHIYFAPGIDLCQDAGLTVCYSPDNFNTFYFCAFHGSVDFSDIGHVLFSIEPYANVVGCQVNQPSPNGPVVDSQMNVLSHELMEAITDPDGTAWWNSYALGLYGEEIGDECGQAYFIYGTVQLAGHPYEIQPEYSNQAHACTYSPGD